MTNFLTVMLAMCFVHCCTRKEDVRVPLIDWITLIFSLYYLYLLQAESAFAIVKRTEILNCLIKGEQAECQRKPEHQV